MVKRQLLEGMPVERTVGMAFRTTLANEMAIGTRLASQLVLLLTALVADSLGHGSPPFLRPASISNFR